ncbi:Epoxide hydrolase 2 [Morus notabilis]|uniref:Epoxide hydrolase 2 n=1 Tax=Morus notabilis TaxID=981085 RepID=W9RNL8_9ROSA|nr:Epoxide hydrolase 2 [Morus notabilis]
MIGVANAGYQAIAPDLRGNGVSDPHPQLDKASLNDFVNDTLSILVFFNIEKAFLVGKDFGSWPVYLFCLIHPTRVCGVRSLGVPFFPPDPQRYKDLPEGFYIFRWKEPGRAEADFGRNIYILFSRSEIPIADKGKEIMDLVDSTTSPCDAMGEKDFFLKFPGIEDYVRSEKMKKYVPDLKVKFLSNGTHFMQEQFPEHLSTPSLMNKSELVSTQSNEHV